MDITRRNLLKAGGTALVARALPRTLLGVPMAAAAPAAIAGSGPDGRIQFASAPFTLGVASGDPTPDAVVIWTRYAPDPFAAQGGMTGSESIVWSVATDPQFNNLVDYGTVTANPADAGSVHVDVTGLSPSSHYYYGFMDSQYRISDIGEMRTAPQGTVNQTRFAAISCNDIESGRFGAFAQMMQENLDFIVHMGDYIYEGPLSSSWPSRARGVLTDLEGYRKRYALYRGDPQLRIAHQKLPWMITWDDHEVANNYYNEQGSAFLNQRLAAYKAWYEHMPVRRPGPLPSLSGFRVYRKLAYGDLLDLMLLDCRQYRDHPPTSVQAVANPDLTMLGSEQKQWLLNELGSSSAHWPVMVSPVLLSGANSINELPGYTGAWDGFQAERQDILNHVADNDIANFMVLAGDYHRTIISDVKQNYASKPSPVIGSEFCGLSVTSTASGAPPSGGAVDKKQRGLFYPGSPSMRYYEVEHHGYMVCEVSPSQWKTTIRSVNRTSPGASAQTRAEFKVTSGAPGLTMLSGSGGNPIPERA